MKKTIFVLACLLGVTNVLQAQSITFEINAGLLQNATGTAVEPNGGLLQLLASPSGTFAAPTSTSYTGGDNVVLASFAMNSLGGQAGYTSNDFNNFALSTGAYTITPGESVLLRFYPSLTFAGKPAAPALGTTYGQVRSSTAETGIVDGSQTGWIIPSAGSTVDFDYITVSAGQGGTYPNNTAFATGIVLAGLVPEPSTYAMFACGFVGLLGLRLGKRRRVSA